MPNRDGTGPQWEGAKTGRGLGGCNPQESANEEKSKGRGFDRSGVQGKGNGRRKNRNRDL